MKKYLLIFKLILITTITYSSNDVWIKLTVVQSDCYSFKQPSAWRALPTIEAYGLNHFYSADGLGFPIMYNEIPHMGKIWLVEKNKYQSLKQAVKSLTDDYTVSKDHVFNSKPVYHINSFKLKSGDNTRFLSARFYRKSKSLYQNRYDQVAFSKTSRHAILYTLSIQ
ncbi:MAG: hypothetical protein OEZ36_14520, partial [Spirochaetota bacterium]|nr:hypothetical protein [Spirochaetota bacterium]